MSDAAVAAERSTAVRLRRFFRTPKGLLVVVLTVLTLVASAGSGVVLVAPGLIAAAGVAMLVDAPIVRAREGEWLFPSGALLTGMLVAMILSPHQRWYVAAATSAVAVLSKYIARTRSANVFNPAAVAIVATYFIFHTGQSWWGALPEIPLAALVVLFATGIFITNRVNKLSAVVAFLGCYYLLFTLAAFIGDPGHVAGIFRAPDLHAVLFFAFFMVTDPPTSPPKPRDQIVFGLIVAVVSFAWYETEHSVYFLLAGLLVGNLWEAWRRGYHRRAREKRGAKPAVAT